MVNTGNVVMYGKQRSNMSRLRATCRKGDRSTVVETGLDWVEGDRLALMPTAVQHKHTDYVTVETYDSATGKVTFGEIL